MDFKSILLKNKKADYPFMKKSMNIILIVAVIVLLAGNIIFGYLFFSHRNPGQRGGFSQLTESQIQGINSFFESNPSI
ncbi:MAG TPA: hypothetical protein VMC07_03305, partial [Candidatus Omnitrophota bacterium]|nr:hypothetical protein [Candidatus Omnitrophota bacterium]